MKKTIQLMLEIKTNIDFMSNVKVGNVKIGKGGGGRLSG
jgi:hypothetical protein